MNDKLIKEIQEEILKLTASQEHRKSDNDLYREEMNGYQRGVREFGYYVINKMKEYNRP